MNENIVLTCKKCWCR